ncbi:DMT family transporter [Ruixingdingia sedimenti]|uniref:DMT family transporter n=1 Tax=Ruixingdingia sedimenti TaxID=3073604 RepID=A0ABU1F2U7_9RHOB|nr:DMT family transporter [Xinfangfangia sp. LG-4]MDR5651183.1 DMT family transporter [Xinfangfangia sp. LG-4]
MSTPPTPRPAPTPLVAIWFIIAAFFLFSCTDAAAKYLIRDGVYPPFASWIRFMVQGVLVAALFRIWTRPRNFGTRQPWRHVLRSCLLLLSGVFSFAALDTLQLAEFISIIFLGPLMIVVMGRVFLKERVEWQRYAAVLSGLAGVLIITRPGLGGFHIGHVIALMAVTTYSGFAVATRMLAATETQESLMFIPAIMALVVMGPAVIATGPVPDEPLHWLMMCGLGVTGATGQFLVVRAYRIAAASALAPYNYLQMIWSASLGYLVFGDLPDIWTVTGSLVIVASGIYLMHRDRLARRAAG